MNEWQTLESFPDDQPLLLFYKDYGQTIGGFTAGHWITDDSRIRINTVPERWMDLPKDEIDAWQLIASAPKDRLILLFYPNRKLNKAIGKWDEVMQGFDTQWKTLRSYSPTRWMDLPEAPKEYEK